MVDFQDLIKSLYEGAEKLLPLGRVTERSNGRFYRSQLRANAMKTDPSGRLAGDLDDLSYIQSCKRASDRGESNSLQIYQAARKLWDDETERIEDEIRSLRREIEGTSIFNITERYNSGRQLGYLKRDLKYRGIAVSEWERATLMDREAQERKNRNTLITLATAAGAVYTISNWGAIKQVSSDIYGAAKNIYDLLRTSSTSPTSATP